VSRGTIALSILRGLARVLLSIGGWLLRQGARVGWRKLVAYLEVRAEHFAERGRELGEKMALRREWLRDRARRWRRAAKWLEANWPSIDGAIADAEARATAGIDAIPEHVDAEDLRRWKRARARRGST